MRYTAEQTRLYKNDEAMRSYLRHDDGGDTRIPLPPPEPYLRKMTRKELLERLAGRRC